jgi:hypothetical protein
METSFIELHLPPLLDSNPGMASDLGGLNVEGDIQHVIEGVPGRMLFSNGDGRG